MLRSIDQDHEHGGDHDHWHNEFDDEERTS